MRLKQKHTQGENKFTHTYTIQSYAHINTRI